MYKIYAKLTKDQNDVNDVTDVVYKMNTIYIGKLRYTPMIHWKNKIETLVWRLMKDLARN